MDTLSSSTEAVTEISVSFTSSVVPTKQYLTFEKFLSHISLAIDYDLRFTVKQAAKKWGYVGFGR